MAETRMLKIENDEFHPTELSINIGDAVEVKVDGFLPPGQQSYTVLCSEFPNKTISFGQTLTHKFENPGNYLIEVKEIKWMKANIIVRSNLQVNRSNFADEVIATSLKELSDEELLNKSAETLDKELEGTEKEIEAQKSRNCKMAGNGAENEKKKSKKKSKDKKTVQKFNRMIRTSMENTEELANLIVDICQFSTKHEREQVRSK
jgi:hypothetical protein